MSTAIDTRCQVMSTLFLCISTSLFTLCSFFFNATATTEIYTLSLHDALPIFRDLVAVSHRRRNEVKRMRVHVDAGHALGLDRRHVTTHTLRSEEHTSELQSRRDLVCRLLLEKKKKKQRITKRHEYSD